MILKITNNLEIKPRMQKKPQKRLITKICWEKAIVRLRPGKQLIKF